MNGINQEELSRCLFEESNDAFFIFDPETNEILDVNPTAERLTGMHRKQLLGIKLPELVRVDQSHDVKELIRAYQSTGFFHSKEGYRLRSLKNDALEVNLSVSRIHTSPKPLGLVVARDISKRRRAEDALKKMNEELDRRVQQRTAELEQVNRKLQDEIAERFQAEELLANREELYRNAISAANAVAYQLDFESNSYTHIDEHIEQLLGFEAATFQPEIWKQVTNQVVLSGEAAAFSLEKAKQLYRIGKIRTWHADYQCTTKDGQTKWISDSSVLLRNEQGDVTGCLGILQDITDRKQADESLRGSEEQLRSLLEQNPDGVGVVANGRFVFANTRLGELTGYGHDAMIGCSPTDFIVPVDHERVLCCMGDIMAGKPTAPLELLFSRKNGETVPVEVLSRRFQFQGSSALLCVIRDITERKQAEEALRKSEIEFRLLSNNVPALFSYIDTEGCYRFANRRYEEWFGIPAAEIVGKHYREIVGNSVDETIKAHIEAALSGERVEYEAELPFRHGGTRWVNAIYVPDKIEGEVRGFFALVTDITERKRADEALRTSEARSRALLEGSPVCIKIVDLDTRLQYMSAAGREQLKIPDIEPFYGCTFPPNLYPKRWQKLATEHLERAKLGETSSVECCVLDTEGNELWYDTTFVPACDNEGRVENIIVTSVNITERKRAQEEVRQHQEKLAHVTRLSTMGEMATGLAHELNQPLSAISTYCFAMQEILKRSSAEQSERLQELLEKVTGQANRASDIIKHLRNMVRKASSEYSSTEMGQVVREVIGLLEPDLRLSAVRLELNFDESIATVMVDRILIQQVLVNLLRNAIDAMSETEYDDRTLIITTSMHDQNQIEVAVCDSGQGLLPDNGNQVFDAFFTTKSDGMGMGLAISRSIIESHDGRLWVTPNPDRGVTFYFTLPIPKSPDYS